MWFFRIILNKFFGVQFVVLKTIGGTFLRRAYVLGDRVYAHPYLPDTRAELLPDGSVEGPIYVKSWHPATKEISKYYNDSQNL